MNRILKAMISLMLILGLVGCNNDPFKDADTYYFNGLMLFNNPD